MANAANKFLASLTPEQRQQATFAFESEELTRWHYVPAQQFPRNGLADSRHERGAARPRARAAEDRVEPARLHPGDDDHERPREHPEGARERIGDARSGAVCVLRLRHARRQRRVGMAGQRPSPVAAFQRRQRLDRRQRADILRIESRRSARGRTEEGTARARRP